MRLNNYLEKSDFMAAALKCLLCNFDTEIFFKEKGREFFKCGNCLSIMLNPTNYISKINEKARYENHNNDVDDIRYQNFVAPIVKSVIKDYKSSHIGLDFGAGTGPVITSMLEKKGYELNLYDPYFHNYPQNLNRKHDFIVCCEVIEHFYNPFKEFKLMSEILNPNGRLYCMTSLYDEEINFEDLVYDMNIISDRKDVFSTNFNQYYDDIEENYIFYNSMSIFLEDSVKEILEHALFEPSILYENEKYKKILATEAFQIDKDKPLKRFSYSVYKLFENNQYLENKDKYFILNNLSLLKSSLMIPESICINIGNDKKSFIDLSMSKLKYHSIIIDKIGEALMTLKTKFSKKILGKLNEIIIEPSFYRINRKLRNNIHYTSISKFTESEKAILLAYQTLYLETIIDFIEKELNLDIDRQVISMTEYLQNIKVDGINKDKIYKCHYFNYLKFLLKRKLSKKTTHK